MKVFPREELEHRTCAVQAGLRRDGIDAAIVLQNVDLYYLSGTIQQSHLVVPAEGEPVLLVRRDLDRALTESALPHIRGMKGIRDLPEALRAAGIASTACIGLEFDVLPLANYLRYRRLLPEATFADCSPAIREARAVKSPLEIGLIAEACVQADLVYQAAGRVLREGMTEIELAAELESVARKAGHHGPTRFRAFNMELFFGHVLSGPNGAVASLGDTPLAGRGLTPAVAQGAGNRVIQRNEPVIIDLSGGSHGYLCDQTRVYSLGPLPEELRLAYRVCLDLQELLVAAAVPGATCGELYDLAAAYAASRGYEDHFMGAGPARVSFVGHGVGLEIDELPVLAKGARQQLTVGNVIAIEPKLVFPGVGAVGVENTWRVGASGAERLTITPDGIWEV